MMAQNDDVAISLDSAARKERKQRVAMGTWDEIEGINGPIVERPYLDPIDVEGTNPQLSLVMSYILNVRP